MRYSFDSRDLRTGWVRKLPLPIGNRLAAVQLVYDTEVSLRELSLAGVAIVGTVADRFGSSTELCSSLCPR